MKPLTQEEIYQIPSGYTRDSHGNTLTYRDYSGTWCEYTRDSQGNTLTYRDYSGNWWIYTRDSHGNELTYRESRGNWHEYTRDRQGNELTYRESNGNWYKYTRDSQGNELTYWDYSGLWMTLGESEFTLRYNPATKVYWAGCFIGPLEVAIDRWIDRTDARAMLFISLILTNEFNHSQGASK